MRIPPYLPVSRLSANMVARPAEAFFLKADDYRVIDGDTIRVLAPAVRPGAARKEAFRIRLYSVNTPEKPKRRGSEGALGAAGIDPYEDSLGRQAEIFVRHVCQDRALFIEPVVGENGRNTDKYGRLLANIAISGVRGPYFNTEGAYALAPYLVKKGYAHPMRNLELPPDVPVTIWHLNQAQKDRSEFSEPSF